MRCIAAVLLLLTLLFGPPLRAQPVRPTPAIPGLTHVILISMDGARPDALRQAPAPTLITLAESGAASWTAQTVLPSVTLPAHTSMLTGLSVEDHGVDWNGMDIGCPPIAAPTLLTLAAQAGYRTALVAGKDKFCHFAQDDRTDYYLAPVGDRTSADRVLELLDAGCEVIFAHFPNPDYFGHRNGWMSEVYLYELRNTDAALARVLAKLDELSLTDETLVIVTADHGGHDFEHGSARAEDMTIPWVIAGPGVVPGTTLTDIHITDTAVTVLWALGLPLPDRAAGRPVLEAFGLTSADAPTSVAPGDRNRVTV